MSLQQFIIRKGGYYYRPNAQGYTSSLVEAGRYSEAEAVAHMEHCDPGEITIFPAPAVPASPTLAQDIAATAERIVLEHIAAGLDIDVSSAGSRLDMLAVAIATALEIERAAAPPRHHVVPTTGAWQWWAGSDEEWCTVGPEDTRGAIIQAATNDSLGEFEHEGGGWNLSFHIVEARQDPLRLADWIEADRLLERAEESMSDSDRVSSEYDDGPWFECTPEQEKDLEERVKRACDEWQAAHRLVFTCATFSHTRNKEHVIVELPDDRATTEGSDNG